ncbi:MAG: DNA polymerase III subunit gamma/tau [Candidatus Hydrogenedens sp.]|nr:DNA polymerase III subunit gamma/tau [Candidatus Hydrogenedens sp.]
MADERYLVLARKWRPHRFDDVVGQEHITRTLRNAITSGRIHHAFLFIGSRGIGKTTTARILAAALNCTASDKPNPDPCGECFNCQSIATGNHIDVIEIDGASNNGIDDIRDIRDNIRMVPSNGRYKVYIIDEVHQLSLSAFNGLLKTLEEPPPHAIFILATTEAHKIPATIISRCQRYDFRRVSIERLVELLRGIVEAEGLSATPEALHAIARAAEGGVRDSESILDELITYCDGQITFQDVFDVLGLVDWEVLRTLSNAILERDIARQLRVVEQVVAAGKDLSQFVQEILRYYRNLLVCKTAGDTELLHLPDDEVAQLQKQAEHYGLAQLIRMVEQFAELTSGFDSQLAQRTALEALLIRTSKMGVGVTIDTILEKLAALEANGLPQSAPGAAPSAPAPRPKAAASPPDPPDAGAAPPAPPAPAKPAARRMTVDADNLRPAWMRITESISKESMSLGVWLGNGRPVRIDGDTLVLLFPHDQAQARDIVQKPENRDSIAAMLESLTENIRALRTELEAPPKEDTGKPEDHPDLPMYQGLDEAAAKHAAEDPLVADVLDVFKGRIAAIHAPAALPAAAAEALEEPADEDALL